MLVAAARTRFNVRLTAAAALTTVGTLKVTPHAAAGGLTTTELTHVGGLPIFPAPRLTFAFTFALTLALRLAHRHPVLRVYPPLYCVLLARGLVLCVVLPLLVFLFLELEVFRGGQVHRRGLITTRDVVVVVGGSWREFVSRTHMGACCTARCIVLSPCGGGGGGWTEKR